MKCEKPLWVRSQAAFSFKAAYAKPRPAALPLSLRSPSARLIEADRHALGDRLKGLHFDLVVDTAYAAEDIKSLAQALDGYDDYVLISSSAVFALF